MRYETFLLEKKEWLPNNPLLPAILYTDAIASRTEADAKDFEALFRHNGWPPQWRGSVYSYHHYHSTAHEVLGCARGSARLMLGGPLGREIEMSRGQVLVIPAGVGHCSLETADGFEVVGAYPPGQDWDICRKAPDANALHRISRVPIPAFDPVEGKRGALKDLWRG